LGVGVIPVLVGLWRVCNSRVSIRLRFHLAGPLTNGGSQSWRKTEVKQMTSSSNKDPKCAQSNVIAILTLAPALAKSAPKSIEQKANQQSFEYQGSG